MTRQPTETRSTESMSLAEAIRRTAEQLEALPGPTASLLDALALVLVRVADADRLVNGEEALHMERTLVAHAGINQAQAALVIEIAKRRARLADRGAAYAESRRLRGRLDHHRRVELIGWLHEVAAADGVARGCELDEIHELAAELGFTSGDVAALRRGQLGA